MAYYRQMIERHGIELTPTAAPSNPTAGQIYYDSTADLIYGYDGTSFVALSNQYIALGGVMTSYTVNGVTFMVHTFKESGVFIPQGAGDIDYCIVAGGGGAMTYSGGAGAGGVRTHTGYAATAQSYAINVGSGGSRGAISGNSPLATSGGNSTLVPTSGTTISATGGAHAKRAAVTPIDTGGCGAGAGSGASNLAGGAGNAGGDENSLPEGFAGGASIYHHNSHPAGGGGGAGAVGTAGTDGQGGNGGAGLKILMAMSAANTTLMLAAADAGVVESSDSNLRYIAGGGGGSTRNGSGFAPGAGGLGGGGDASVTAHPNTAGPWPEDGLINTGGGGGGFGNFTTAANRTTRGGSGIVILRYKI